MDAVSPPGGQARPPWLQSAAALIGIVVLVVLSIAVGVRFWWERDPALAFITVGAELVAFAGLGVAHWQWSRSRRLAIGAFIVTTIAAAWCAFTMFQNIAHASRLEAIREAQERPQYVFASNAAQTAERLLTARLRSPNPRPTCTCPQTIAAWEASEGAAIERLRNERDAAVRQMETAIPQPEMDALALARGIGVEIAKLFGFIVFVLALGPPRRKRGAPPAEQPWSPKVVAGTDAPARSPIHPPARPLVLRRMVGWRPLLAGLFGFGVASTQQLPPPARAPITSPSEPAPPARAPEIRDVVDLRAIAAQLSAQRLGERRIAARLNVTRWEVRKLLGRVAA